MRTICRASLPILCALLEAFAVLSAAGCSGSPERPNIILVILDTVRSDYTGVGGNRANLTPQLDQLAAEGTVFRNSWSTAPWTLPSHASLFTGMLSSGHGCHINNWRFDARHETLAGILGRVGYETAAFFSNPWLSDRLTGVLYGFTVRHESLLGGPDGMSKGRGDQGGFSINRQVAEWLDQRRSGEPFFLFVNYLEAHLPYDPPLEYRARQMTDLSYDDVVSTAWSEEFNAGLHPPESVDWERVRRLYGGDVHAADRLLSDLMAMLRSRGLYEESVIVVTSDHGENLGDHDLLEHQFSIYENLLSVPLVVRAPGRLVPGVRDDPVMLTDLFATILDMADVEDVEVPPHSRSLLSGERAGEGDRLVVAEYGGGHPSLVANLKKLNPDLEVERFERALKTVRRGRFRLTAGSDGSLTLHDLDADPAQAIDVAEEHPLVVEELREAMENVLGEDFLTERKEISVDEETLERLRSLGYVK